MAKDVREVRETEKNGIICDFWTWFIEGNEGSRPGYKRIFDKWLKIHVLLGIIISAVVDKKTSECANAVLFPLASIFVGMAIAFFSTTHNILDSEEIQLIAKEKKGGISDYIYSYQLSVLVIIVALVYSGFCGLGLFDFKSIDYVSKFLLFSIVSFTIRECWQIVLSAHVLLLMKKRIRDEQRKDC